MLFQGVGIAALLRRCFLLEENKKESRGKVVRSFILRTLLYSLVLLGLIYLYEYCGVGSTGFIYNEF